MSSLTPQVALAIWAPGIAATLYAWWRSSVGSIFLAITTCLPVCYGLSLAGHLNAASTGLLDAPLLSSPLPYAPLLYAPLLYASWAYAIAIFVYVQLLNAPWISIGTWLITYSFTIAFLSGSAVSEALILGNAFATIVVVGAISNRNLEVVHEHQMVQLRNLGGYIAHELRTTLMGISARIRGIRRIVETLSVPDEERSVARLDLIESRAQSTNRLLNMYLFKLERNPCRGLERSEIGVDEFVRTCIDTFPYQANVIAPQVSGVVSRETVSMYERPLRYAVFHMLKNCYEHGKGRVHITTDNTPLRIRIEDEGPGRPASPGHNWQALASSQRLITPEGLGLSYCKRVAEAHGGSFRIGTTPSGGTYAEISLI